MTVVISQSGDTVINADKIISFGIQEANFVMTKDGWYGKIVNSYAIYVDYGTGAKVIGNFYGKEKAMKILKEMMYAIQAEKDYSLPKEEDLE